jgi:hypothetical protein
MLADYGAARRRVIAAMDELDSVLRAEISAYPTPISGCDAQFNHLLAERQRLADARKALSGPVFVPTPRMPIPASRVESR